MGCLSRISLGEFLGLDCRAGCESSAGWYCQRTPPARCCTTTWKTQSQIQRQRRHDAIKLGSVQTCNDPRDFASRSSEEGAELRCGSSLEGDCQPDVHMQARRSGPAGSGVEGHRRITPGTSDIPAITGIAILGCIKTRWGEDGTNLNFSMRQAIRRVLWWSIRY
jgi:hypothetical protein